MPENGKREKNKNQSNTISIKSSGNLEIGGDLIGGDKVEGDVIDQGSTKSGGAVSSLVKKLGGLFSFFGFSDKKGE